MLVIFLLFISLCLPPYGVAGRLRFHQFLQQPKRRRSQSVAAETLASLFFAHSPLCYRPILRTGCSQSLGSISIHPSLLRAPSLGMTVDSDHLPESQLIELSEQFLEHGTGFYSGLQPDLMAEDFVFRGGVVGPLNKRDYLRTMRLLGVANAFNLRANAFGFTRDPDDPMCIRFFIRNRGEHVQSWQPWGVFPPTPLQPTPGKTKVIGPTETGRLCFSADGKVRLFSTGLVVGRFESAQGRVNTNGFGAVLGLFHAIGFGSIGNLALNQQVRDGSNFIADKLDFLQIPKTKTSEPDVPRWWTE